MRHFNIARGRTVEFYNRVKTGDPANAGFVVVPLESSGIETDDVLFVKRTLAAVLAGSTNEQTALGRKYLFASDLAAWAPDDVANSVTLALPSVTWAAASGPSIAKTLLCFQRDVTVLDDSLVVPIVIWDTVRVPDGSSLLLNGGTFYRTPI